MIQWNSVVGGGKEIIGRITGCKGIVVVGQLGVFVPAYCGIEGGTWGSDVVGNVSDGVGSLAFFCSELIQPSLKIVEE